MQQLGIMQRLFSNGRFQASYQDPDACRLLCTRQGLEPPVCSSWLRQFEIGMARQAVLARQHPRLIVTPAGDVSSCSPQTGFAKGA